MRKWYDDEIAVFLPFLPPQESRADPDLHSQICRERGVAMIQWKPPKNNKGMTLLPFSDDELAAVNSALEQLPDHAARKAIPNYKEWIQS